MPDARRVIWAPKAEDDLREIWHYFVRVASPETAENLLREITSASVRLGERPFFSVGRATRLSLGCVRLSFHLMSFSIG
jgi:plasmid stabilization system protein ParE